MKKKFNLAKITSFVLLLTVTAMILVAGTYAKYSSSASGTDATVVAKWSFKVNGTEIAVKGSASTVDFNLFETINDIDGKVETDVAEGLIAPGTAGKFEFVLLNSSEVTTRYAINLEVKEGSNVPLEFSLDDGNSWTKITELSDLVATDVIGIGLSKNVTVQWKWAFGENETTDASLGGQKVEITANITATQVDNGDVAVEEPILNDLEGKSAIFFGDSVAYGYSTNGNGFGYYVNEVANFSNFTNAAVNTATLNTETQETNNVIEQMKKNTATSYDYVIIEGGYGDLRDEPELGSLTDGYVVSEFDTTTFAGAVEYTLYLATTSWEDARIGFIISYDTPNSNYGVRPDHDATKEYWDIVKAACDKWNVDYLDFFEGSTTYNGETKTYSELFDVTGNTYLSEDNIHPTAAGYEFIAPFIADWMRTLSVYERDFEITENDTTETPSTLTIVDSFNDLVFVKDRSAPAASTKITSPTWQEETIVGRASAVNYIVAVNGGETIGLSSVASGVTYALVEYDSNKTAINTNIDGSNGQNHRAWLSENVTLQTNTRYLLVSFKNGNGSTSFTDEQIALLPTYLEIK